MSERGVPFFYKWDAFFLRKNIDIILNKRTKNSDAIMMG